MGVFFYLIFRTLFIITFLPALGFTYLVPLALVPYFYIYYSVKNKPYNYRLMLFPYLVCFAGVYFKALFAI